MGKVTPFLLLYHSFMQKEKDYLIVKSAAG